MEQIIKNPNWGEADQLAVGPATENKSKWQWGGEFEPGTSRFQIQRPKPLGHAASKVIGLSSAVWKRN